MALAAGERIGPYEVSALAGEGGMGEVYRARDSRLGREVAVKVLSPDAILDTGRRARFEVEARAASALNHPNILAVYDIGEHAGQPYIVTEFVEGETLRTVLHRGRMPARRVLDIAVQIAGGLAAAHSAKITHRDLKPENIMLTRDSRVKILDFGLAKISTPAPDEATVRVAALSEPGTVMGTVAYMSPEQARGTSVDYRSDQFSFGVILHEMLAGKQPFTRDSMPETMTAILKDDMPPLDPGVPAPLRWAIERLLAKDPEERYTATQDLFRDLRTIRERLSETQTTATQAITAGEPVRRKRTWWWVATLTVVAFLAGLFLADNPTVDLRKLTFTPLYSDPQFAPEVAWSADGKSYLVGEREQIYQRPLDGGSPVSLLRTPVQQIASLHPTPDGRTIYFTASPQGTRSLLAVSAAGGTADLVYPLGGFVALTGVVLSPDGKWIVVARDEKGKARLAFASPPGAPLQDYPHELEWKGPTRRFLRFAPDGKRLAVVDSYTPGTPLPSEVYVLPWPPSAGKPQRIAPSLRAWRFVPEWMPDNRHWFASITERSGGGSALAITDDHLGTITPITAGNDTTTRQTALFRDGRVLVNETFRNANVIAINVESGTTRSIGNEYENESYPSWMPNGDQFVYSVNRRGTNELWLADKNGVALRRLVTGIESPGVIAVSPDGRQIAFSTATNLYIAPATGGSAVEIGNGISPSWSPDGNWLCYRANPGNPGEGMKLFKIRPGPNQSAVPVSDARSLGPPSWSPDGKWIAFRSDKGIERISPDGKERAVISTRAFTLSEAMVWTKDSRALILTVDPGNVATILELSMNGAEKTILTLKDTLLTVGIVGGNSIDLSPDGKTLLTNERRAQRRIVLIEGLHLPQRFWQRWMTALQGR